MSVEPHLGLPATHSHAVVVSSALGTRNCLDSENWEPAVVMPWGLYELFALCSMFSLLPIFERFADYIRGRKTKKLSVLKFCFAFKKNDIIYIYIYYFIDVTWNHISKTLTAAHYFSLDH